MGQISLKDLQNSLKKKKKRLRKSHQRELARYPGMALLERSSHWNRPSCGHPGLLPGAFHSLCHLFQGQQSLDAGGKEGLKLVSSSDLGLPGQPSAPCHVRAVAMTTTVKANDRHYQVSTKRERRNFMCCHFPLFLWKLSWSVPLGLTYLSPGSNSGH